MVKENEWRKEEGCKQNQFSPKFAIMIQASRKRCCVSFPHQCHPRRLPRRKKPRRALSDAGHRLGVLPSEQCGRVQGFGHVDHHGTAAASLPRSARALGRCPAGISRGPQPMGHEKITALLLRKRRQYGGSRDGRVIYTGGGRRGSSGPAGRGEETRSDVGAGTREHPATPGITLIEANGAPWA